jgi:hypothetical protein
MGARLALDQFRGVTAFWRRDACVAGSPPGGPVSTAIST